MSTTSSVMPPLPENHRPVRIATTLLAIWATSTTLVIILAVVFWITGLVALSRFGGQLDESINQLGKEWIPVSNESICVNYWGFLLDAKKSGISDDEIEAKLQAVKGTRGESLSDICGEIE